MSERTRARWLSIILSVAMLVALSGGITADELTPGDASVQDAADQAIAYLADQQQTDGGLSGFGGDSDVATSALGLVALGLTGPDSSDSVPDVQGLMDYVVTNAITYTHVAAGTTAEELFPGRTGQVLTALAAALPLIDDVAVQNAEVVATELISQLEATYDADLGTYATEASEDWTTGAASASSQSWVILGMSLQGTSVPITATQWLIEQQAEDGTFGAGDPDTTALAGMALVSSGQVDADDPAIQAIITYFNDTQLDSAGWRPSWDTDPLNADTTGWVIQFLRAVGIDPDSADWQNVEGLTPRQALAGLQNEEGVIGGTYANLYSTVDALLGLADRSITTLAVQAIPEGDSVNRVGLVVEKSDGSIITRCITFTEDELSGLDVLLLSGLDVDYNASSQGTAICSIDGDGCPSGDCFCDFPDRYWSYWQWIDGAWQYASAGATDIHVVDGDVQGWANTLDGQAPSFTPGLEQICQMQTESENATATAIPTVEPTTAFVATAEPVVTDEVVSTTLPTAASESGEMTEPNETAGYVILSVLVIALASSFFVARRKHK